MNLTKTKTKIDLDQKGVEDILGEYLIEEGTSGSLTPTMSEVGFSLGKTLDFDPNQCIRYLKRKFLILVFEPFELRVYKTLNLASENESKGGINTEAIKAIVSGDVLNVTRKFKADLAVRQTTKLVFLMNNLPDTLDLSHGFYRKIIILPFPHVFTEEEMDKDRKAKLIKEKSGILNWAMQGAGRLLRQDYRFTEAKAVGQAMKAYQQEQNPVLAFYKEELRYEPGQRVSRKELMGHYKSWLDQNGISPRGTDSPQRFWKLLGNAANMAGAEKLDYCRIHGAAFLVDHWLPNKPISQ